MAIYFTPNRFINAVSNVYRMAYADGWTYGDSHALPPCSDRIISCDRLVARALWDLGLTDQPRGGITVINMESYLLKWGFKKITNAGDLLRGDIVLMRANGQTSPSASWHAFVLTAYNPATQICSKYDEGSNERIRSPQPFVNVPLNEWIGRRTFYAGFRCPAYNKRKETYEKTFSAVYDGKKNSSVRVLQKLLRYANCRGKDGKALVVDGVCGENTVHAINVYQSRKRRQGIELGTDGKNDGICGSKMWKAMIG